MTVSGTNTPTWTPPRWLVMAASVVLVGLWIAARLSPEQGLAPGSNERPDIAAPSIAASSETTAEPPVIAGRNPSLSVEPDEASEPPASVPTASAHAAPAEPVAPTPPVKPATPGPKVSKPAEKPAPEHSEPASKRIVVQNVTIKDQSGKTVYKGEIDLTPTLARIERGDRHEHRNDGSTFRNLEGRLPKKPVGYYKEYVHPTPGIGGPGPQRVVIGEAGEAYYTHDHYRTFRKVRS